MRYDPNKRLTSRQCLEHVYLQETIPRDYITVPTGVQSTSSSSIPTMSSYVNGSHSNPSLPTPNHIPPTHSQPFPDASISHRIPYPIPSHQPQFPSQPVVAHNEYHQHPNGTWHDPQPDYPMASPQDAHPPHRPYANDHDVDTQDLSEIQNPRPPEPPRDTKHAHASQSNKLVGKLGATLKKQGRWTLFGGDKAHHNALPPVDETSPVIFPPRKRTESSSTDSRSAREASPIREPALNARDLKKQEERKRKEAQRVLREAEIAKRELARKSHQEQARAVMLKRKEVLQASAGEVPEWPRGPDRNGPMRRGQVAGGAASTTIGAASGKFAAHNEPMRGDRDREGDWDGPAERAKARRREFDDDHSMSSSDLHSLSRVSSISFATVDSDPGPSRLRSQRSLYSISRMTSRSSLRTSFDDFPPSARSSNWRVSWFMISGLRLPSALTYLEVYLLRRYNYSHSRLPCLLLYLLLRIGPKFHNTARRTYYPKHSHRPTSQYRLTSTPVVIILLSSRK